MGSVRFVRVPPYESGVKMTNFSFSWQNGEFFWSQKCCTHFLTQNEELSKKIGACICIYTSDENLLKNRPRTSTSKYKQPPINLRLFQNTVKFLDNFFLSKKAKISRRSSLHCPIQSLPQHSFHYSCCQCQCLIRTV